MHLKRKFVWILAVLFMTEISYGQTFVYDLQLDSIQSEIENSGDFLKEINQKMIQLDVELRPIDFFWIYYGSAYLDGYSPYGEGLNEKVIVDCLNQDKVEEAITLCEKEILEHPGYIKPFYFLGIAYDMKGDSLSASGYFDRYYNFLSVPFFSGNGNGYDSAFVVRSVDDEYIIIRELGFQVTQQALVHKQGIPFDIMTVKDPLNKEENELYFNVTQPYLMGLNFNIKQDEKLSRKSNKKKKKSR